MPPAAPPLVAQKAAHEDDALPHNNSLYFLLERDVATDDLTGSGLGGHEQ